MYVVKSIVKTGFCLSRRKRWDERLFLAIELVEHIVVKSLAALIVTLIAMTWIAEHFMNFHVASAVLGRAGRTRHWGRGFALQ